MKPLSKSRGCGGESFLRSAVIHKTYARCECAELCRNARNTSERGLVISSTARVRGFFVLFVVVVNAGSLQAQTLAKKQTKSLKQKV